MIDGRRVAKKRRRYERLLDESMAHYQAVGCRDDIWGTETGTFLLDRWHFRSMQIADWLEKNGVPDDPHR